MNGVPANKLRQQEDSRRMHDEFIAKGGKVKVLPPYDHHLSKTKSGSNYQGHDMNAKHCKSKSRGELVCRMYNEIKKDHKSIRSAAEYIAAKLQMNFNTVRAHIYNHKGES